MRVSLLLLVAALALNGCATTPDSGSLRLAPLPFRTLEGARPVRDGRAVFRAVFCSTLREDGLLATDQPGCDQWLWQLPGEPEEATEAGGLQLAAPGLAVFLVTGAFSECVGETSRPFATGATRLRAAGASVETIVVSGRSGTASNARQIAAAIEAAKIRDDQDVVVIGYSKGSLDALRFLVDFPRLGERVDALVSVASPIFGTPLADTAEPAYSALLAKLPYAKCPPGDGEVVNSLRPAVATQWLAANPLPEGTRYYSLAAFTTREHVARALVPAWEMLNRSDVRNDGQVVAADAVIPGSTLLGFTNADHWGIAQRIEATHPVLAARQDPVPFPLDHLFRSIITFVARDLDRERQARQGGGP